MRARNSIIALPSGLSDDFYFCRSRPLPSLNGLKLNFGSISRKRRAHYVSRVEVTFRPVYSNDETVALFLREPLYGALHVLLPHTRHGGGVPRIEGISPSLFFDRKTSGRIFKQYNEVAR